MKLIMESWRKKVLKEITDWGCNKHSLGWIDPEGTFHDITEDDVPIHNVWMRNHMWFYHDEEYKDNTIPDGWIKVSNANELFFGSSSWDELTFQQFNGMCDMWSKCRKYSTWLSQDIETHDVLFGVMKPQVKMERLTIPEFIHRYVGREGEDLFFQMLY
tara:strand:- start:232 stop:708 length:477 start_codon:yes stop_codon:yes gene_type:complete